MRKINKVVILAFVLVLALATALAACTTPATTTVTTTVPGLGATATTTVTATAAAKTVTATAPGTTVTATAPATAPAAQKYKLTAQMIHMPGTWDYTNSEKKLFLRMMQESGGRLDIQLSGAGSIVPDAQGFSAVSKGIIDMVMTNPLLYSGELPGAKVESMYPGTCLNMREIMIYRQYGWLDVLQKMYEARGVHVFGHALSYESWDVVSKKPITKLADIKGLKIRAGGAIGDVLAKAGASVTVIPATEIYTSLSTGIIDAASYGGLSNEVEIGLTEVAKYAVMGIGGNEKWASSFLMNKQKYDSMPLDLQKIIDNVGDIAGMTYLIETMFNATAAAKKFVSQQGGQMTTLPTADMTTLAGYSIELLDAAAKQDPTYSGALVEIIKKVMALR